MDPVRRRCVEYGERQGGRTPQGQSQGNGDASSAEPRVLSETAGEEGK